MTQSYPGLALPGSASPGEGPQHGIPYPAPAQTLVHAQQISETSCPEPIRVSGFRGGMCMHVLSSHMHSYEHCSGKMGRCPSLPGSALSSAHMPRHPGIHPGLSTQITALQEGAGCSSLEQSDLTAEPSTHAWSSRHACWTQSALPLPGADILSPASHMSSGLRMLWPPEEYQTSHLSNM